MSTNKLESHGWDVEAAKEAQRSKVDKTRQMWRADKYLQRCLYANRVRNKYGVLSDEAARAGWFALALLGLKPTKYQLAAHPGLARFM